MRPPLRTAALLALCACSGGQVGGDRAAWLQARLREDNLVWLARDPSLVADKLGRMAADPFDFMRGTAGIYAADLLRVDGGRVELGALDQPGLAALLFGDAHPENLGTGWPGAMDGGAPEAGGLVVSFFDPDAITFGPPSLELRRAALGFGALRLSPGARVACPRSCVEGMARALGEGWAVGLTEGEADPAEEGLLLGALRLAAAAEEAEPLERLSDVDPETGLLLRAPLDEDGRGQLDLGPAERAQVGRLWAQLRAVHPLRLLDAARRYGSGVSSIPALRVLLLVDQGEEGTQDDRVLDLRELVDPPALPVAGAAVAGVFEDNAQRVEEGAAALWPNPEADPFLLGLTDGEQSFRLRGWRGAFRSFDHLDLAAALEAGAIGPPELAQLAGAAGRALGAAHARAPGPDGQPVGPALRGALRAAGGGSAVGEGLAAGVWADLEQLEADHALLQGLRAAHGPLAGVDAAPTRGAWGEHGVQ
ncbi:MAG: DUF2252 family protein [Deltaproteobacteria bacterium]|nr:DUF2252 family protein [Deltaproteobacteria bacterium]